MTRNEPQVEAVMQVTHLSIPGLCCADEVAAVEKALLVLPGVERVQGNVVARTATVRHDPQRATTEQLLAAIARTGMKASLPGAKRDHGHGVNEIERAHLLSTIASGVFVGLGLAGHWLGAPEWAEIAAFGVAVIAGGWFIAPKALAAIRRLSPDMNLLMSIAVVGALFIKAWDEAASVVFLFSLAELLESYSVTRARRAIETLMEVAPDTALLKSGHEVPVEAVNVGEIIVIKPGARVPLDGVVIAGESNVNQAPITGESMPVEKKPGSDVFAGSINERGSLEVRVTKLSTDSTLAKIIHLVEEAQEQKAPAQRFVDVFARYYTPAVIVLALLIAVAPPLLFGQAWGAWFYRALVMLVIACPCALVISTPVSVVSGLTAAARHGVLIKGGAVLESLGKLRALAVDKTGTITEGRPRVTDVVPLNQTDEQELLRVAAALEAHSEHPLAQAILAHAPAAPRAENFQAVAGKGATGEIKGHEYFIGNHRLVEELAVCSPETERRIEEIERRAQTAVIVGHRPHADCRGEVLGVIAIGDTIRPQAAAAVQQLRRAGVQRVVMLTGDNRATAEAIAKQAGIIEVIAELLPDEKVERVRELLASEQHVGMVGDGINDAPALAAASVGIAMGVAGTDAALETADVALMADDLGKLPEAIALGRRTERIIRFNIAFAILIKLVFLALAATGKATMWMAIAADMGASLVVIINGLRLLASGPRRDSREE
ncbi:MAG: Cadmium-transporting ATPase [Verrucomicrobiae bacterium]|nr:Cadmium-transporting ATPase [Verrucomicrobiae bacterium]